MLYDNKTTAINKLSYTGINGDNLETFQEIATDIKIKKLMNEEMLISEKLQNAEELKLNSDKLTLMSTKNNYRKNKSKKKQLTNVTNISDYTLRKEEIRKTKAELEAFMKSFKFKEKDNNTNTIITKSQFNELSTRVIKEKINTLENNFIRELNTLNLCKYEDHTNFLSDEKNYDTVIKIADLEKDVFEIQNIMKNRFIKFDNFTAKCITETDKFQVGGATANRKSQKDTTGIGTDAIKNGVITGGIIKKFEYSNYDITKYHMETRLEILEKTLDFVEKNKETLNKNGFTIIDYFRAIKTNKNTNELDKPDYSNAHISLIPQIYMKNNNNENIYKLSKAKISIDINDIEGNLKHIETTLDKLLNTTNFAPAALNKLDCCLETYCRTFLVNSMNKIILGSSDSKTEFKEIVKYINNLIIDLNEYLSKDDSLVEYTIQQKSKQYSMYKTKKHFLSSNIKQKDDLNDIKKNDVKSFVNSSIQVISDKINQLNLCKQSKLDYIIFKLKNILENNIGVSYTQSKNKTFQFYISRILGQMEFFDKYKKNNRFNFGPENFQFVPEITQMIIDLYAIKDINGDMLFNKSVENDVKKFLNSFLDDNFKKSTSSKSNPILNQSK